MMDYPKLMKSKDHIYSGSMVVLFTNNHTGVIIETGSGPYLKAHQHDNLWLMSFEDYNGEIKLKNDNTNYPKLMIALDKTIVLFKSETSGVVIKRGHPYWNSPGYYDNQWLPDAFSDFMGTLKIKNSET